ncbi:MAG TPA: gamma-glutamyl-gamma-aminobutyrate hydrolase family protein [Pyrinomonadaceae bacterium]|jgi:GMP synthase (glutamine-hydrolysing)
MICLVDNTIDAQGASPRELKAALERIRPGIEIIVEPFRNVSLQRVKQLGPTHIILSGQSHPWEDYQPESLNPIFEVIREAKQPILGVCGGHQQIALAYGADVGLMKRTGPGEGYEGAFRERGFFPVQLTDQAVANGIFRGLPQSITVWHSHCDEVKELPPGFRRTAGNETCPIQAMEHTSRPLFGVQFHPELFDEDQPHGRRVVENFLDL